VKKYVEYPITTSFPQVNTILNQDINLLDSLEFTLIKLYKLVNNIVNSYLNLYISVKNTNYSKLISFIVKSLKIGLKIINDKDSEKKLEKQILLLQDEIFKFCLENKSVDFIKTFCKLLYRLPRLTLIRRGLCLDSISITSLQID
jgi:hypothetical protein